MTKKIEEGWAADSYKDKKSWAAETTQAAHVLTKATSKGSGLHRVAADAHRRAADAHRDAAISSTHDATIEGHGEAGRFHDLAAGIHHNAHRGESGDANFQTSQHTDALKTLHHKSLTALKPGGMAMAESTEISALVQNIAQGNHTDAADDFARLMDGRLDMKLTARTKELAAQVFGPGVIESVEVEDPTEDDEIASHLQTLADETLADLEDEAGEEGVDVDEFIESFNTAIAAQDELAEYSLWRPEGAKDSHGRSFTRKGIERSAKVTVKKQTKREKAVSKKAAEMGAKARSMSTTHAHNERSESTEVEGTPLTELKARTLRHYVGHAEKQVKAATQEVKKAKAQGKPEIAKHFSDRIAKRKAGMKTVLAKQKSQAAARAASAKAKTAEVTKKEKAIEKK